MVCNYKKSIQWIITFMLVLTVIFSVACGKEDTYFVEFSLSDTLYVDGVPLSASEHQKAERCVGAVLNEIEQQISAERVGSDIAKINAAAAKEVVSVGEHTYALLRLCKKIYTQTGGAFSPSLYNISDLWGFTPRFEGQYGQSRPEPSQEDITVALKNSAFADITVREDHTVVKSNSKVRLDLGGIAKGYMADCAANCLKEQFGNVQGILSVMSGSILLGTKQADAKKLGYTAALENPRKAVSSGIGEGLYVAGLENIALSTGADNYRFYTYSDTIYKHIMNGANGRPAENGVISITVFIPLGTDCACALTDGYSTAGFCMPLTKTLAFYKELNEKIGLSAVVICSDFSYYTVGSVRVMQPKEYAQAVDPSLAAQVENVFVPSEIDAASDTVTPHPKETEYIRLMSENK